MLSYIAFLDANILYPAPIRDIFLQLAVDDLYHAKWSADIHREWIDALLRHEPHRERKALERTRDLMDQATRDSLVTGYETLIPDLTLPDPDDRHVLAAAIKGGCDGIITQNLKDFPLTILKTHDIEVHHPDNFLSTLLQSQPDVFCASIAKVRQRLKNPPYTVPQYMDILKRQGLRITASQLEAHSEVL